MAEPLIGMDPNVDMHMAGQKERAEKLQMLIDLRMQMIQQMYAGTLTMQGGRPAMMPPLKALAEDPYFSKIKFMGKPSGLSDATGQPAMVAVTPAEALEDMKKVLEDNQREIEALESGIVIAK